MAVPLIAALKAAHAANEGVRRFVPGGWKTVISMLVVMVIVIPTMLIYAAISSFNMNPEPMAVCGNPNSNSTSGGGDNDGDGSSGGGGDAGTNKPSAVPFPTEDSTAIVYPVAGATANSTYGPRKSILTAAGWTNKFHDGTDFGAPMGTPIVAMADGIVSMSVNATGAAEGSMMQVQHRIKGQNYTTAYRHIQGKSIKFKVGDTVKVGQQIASVGSEGYSTGPHLHFVLAKGTYHRYNSSNGPAGTVNAKDFLQSNGASASSGGLTGDDFSGGYNPSEDPGSEICVDGTSERLSGDGTTKWNAYDNGEFPKEELTTIGKVTLFKDAANAWKEMAAAYKKETNTELVTKTSYLSLEEQKKRYEEEKQLEKAGKSVFGWARMVELALTQRENETYKWMEKNADKYGWEQPAIFSAGGASDNPAMWGYVGGGEMETNYPPASNATAEENRQTAKKILAEQHPTWNAKEFTCLVKLWDGESDWNHKAANPTTSARGIAQTMMSIHFGKGWATDAKAIAFMNSPDQQIEWGLDYIIGRYDTPCGAWSFWQETDPAKKNGHGGHWY